MAEATGAATGYAGAEAAVTAANDGSLCGVADWRLPTVIELTGLVDNGAAAAETAIDTDFFPGTAAEPYWSGEGERTTRRRPGRWSTTRVRRGC